MVFKSIQLKGTMAEDHLHMYFLQFIAVPDDCWKADEPSFVA